MMNQFNMPPIVQQLLRFMQGYQGNAQAEVQQLLNSGRVTQEQYNNAVQQAQQLQALLSSGVRRQ